MSFNIILMTNNSDENRLDKETVTLSTITGTFRRETSIIKPIIEIEGTIPVHANYMYIETFSRYYFIDDVISTGSNRFEIYAHVDVLTTYKSEIRRCTGIVARQQNAWNLYVDDGTFKIYQNPKITIKKFPNGFTATDFILAVAGG